MIIGNELNYVNQLLSYTANIYCQRCITFVNGLTLYNTVRKDEGTQWIDGKFTYTHDINVNLHQLVVYYLLKVVYV